MKKEIYTVPVFDGEVLAASGSAESEVIDLRQITNRREMSVEYYTTGTGSLLIEYLLCSTKDGTYIDAGTDIGATLAAGRGLLPFPSGEPHVAPFMKIKVTEDGGVNSITIEDMWLNYQ